MKLPAFWSAIFFIFGIWIGRRIILPDMLLLFLGLVLFALALSFLLGNKPKWAMVFITLCLFFAGIFRINLDLANPSGNDISRFNDLMERVSIKGEIVREPDLHPDKTFLTVRPDTLIYKKAKIPVSGLVIVKLKYLDLAFNYADYISVDGFLSSPEPARNPGAFDYRKYLLTQKIRSFVSIGNAGKIHRIHPQTGNLFLRKLVIPLRKYILSVFDRYLESPQSALIAGFLIGETRFIPKDIFQNFRDTGTLHLLAVSGSNVALVVGTVVFFLALARFPLKLRYFISILIIIVFCYLSYNQPSVVRASVMISLYLLGKLAGRNVNYVNIISVAALIILMFEPVMLWDIGFQLSFAATFGLIYFLPRIYRRLKFAKGTLHKMLNWMLLIILASVAAQLTVAPILAHSFNTIPLIGFISNLVIVPLSSLAVILSLLLSFVGWLDSLAKAAGMIAEQILGLTILCVNFFAGLKVVKLNVASPGLPFVLLYYLAIVLAFGLTKRLSYFKYLLFTLLVMANIFIWKGYLTELDKRAFLTVLDVGRDCLVDLKTPGKSRYLVGKLNKRPDFDPAGLILAPYYIHYGVHSIDGYLKFGSDTCVYPESILARGGIVIKNGQAGFPVIAQSDSRPANSSLTVVKNEKNGACLAYIYKIYRNTVIILGDWSILSTLWGERPQPVGDNPVVVLPEASEFDYQSWTVLTRLRPRAVLFSAYGRRYAPAEAQRDLEKLLIQNEISHYSTRTGGALEIIIGPGGYKVKQTIQKLGGN